MELIIKNMYWMNGITIAPKQRKPQPRVCLWGILITQKMHDFDEYVNISIHMCVSVCTVSVFECRPPFHGEHLCLIVLDRQKVTEHIIVMWFNAPAVSCSRDLMEQRVSSLLWIEVLFLLYRSKYYYLLSQHVKRTRDFRFPMQL